MYGEMDGSIHRHTGRQIDGQKHGEKNAKFRYGYI
jgi:hypothetical protein